MARAGRGTIRVFGVVAGTSLVFASLLSATPAFAEETPIAFTEPRAVTIPYGQYWSFTALATETWIIPGPWSGSAAVSGAPAGYTPQTYTNTDYNTHSTTIFVAAQGDARPLPAGKYTVNAVITNASGDVSGDTTAAPATVTITPAALGIEARIVDDPSNQASAIVTARFTGDFLEYQFPTAYASAPLKPAGTWSIVIKDDAGEVAAQFDGERTALDDTLATSFYWPDPDRGGEYTMTASFTQTTESARNFSVESAVPFTYTASNVERAVPVSEVKEQPRNETPVEPDFSVPLWWVLLIGVAMAALMTFAVVFAIRLGRLPRRPARLDE